MHKVISFLSTRKIYLLFFGCILLLLVFRSISDLSVIVKGNYKVNEDRVFRIDSFNQQGSAEYLTSAKGSVKGYQFESINGYSFTIKDVAFEGVINRPKLDKLLKRHDLKFVAYSDKLTLDRYSTSEIPIGVNILQFQVGEEKYIDLEKGIKSYERKLWWLIILEIVVTVLFSFWLLKMLRTHRGNT